MTQHKTLDLINKIQSETGVRFGWDATNGKWRFFLHEFHSPEFDSPEEAIVMSIKFFSDFFIQVKCLAEQLEHENS